MTLEEWPGASILNRILRGKVLDKTESTGKWKKCKRKMKYGNVERETNKTTIVGREIGRRAKGHKGCYTEAVGKIPAQRCSLTRHAEPIPHRGKVIRVIYDSDRTSHIACCIFDILAAQFLTQQCFLISKRKER